MSPITVTDGGTENASTILNATGTVGDEPENEEDEEEEEHVREMIEVDSFHFVFRRNKERCFPSTINNAIRILIGSRFENGHRR